MLSSRVSTGKKESLVSLRKSPQVDEKKPKQNELTSNQPRDRFEKKTDLPHRLERGAGHVGKRVMQEFIATPQALYMADVGDWTLIPWANIALRTEHKLHYQHDDFVQNSDIRRQVSKALLTDEVKEVVWRENAGILDASCGLFGSLPICYTPYGLGASFNFGFQANGMLVYRIIEPLAVNAGEHRNNLMKELTSEMPFKVKSALKMPRGAEIELVGLGKLSAMQGLMIYEGFDLGVTTPGAGIYGVAEEVISREYRLRILALDGKGKMRVTIRKVHDKALALSLRLMAGMLDPSNNVLPQWGQGFLAYLIENRFEYPLQNMLMNVWTISLNAVLSYQTIDDHLYSFDLDLTKQSSCIAYKGLLKLMVRDALLLANDPQSGVAKVEWHEREKCKSRSIDFKAFNDQKFLREVYKVKNHGRLLRPDGTQSIYYDRIYGKKFKNLLTGSKEIRWTGVQIKDNVAGESVYFAFSLERFDRITSQSRVNKFFAFAKSLDIRSTIALQSALPYVSKKKKLYSSKDDTKTEIKLFFTNEGIGKIFKATAEERFLAFLTAQCGFNLDFADYPIPFGQSEWAKEQFQLYEKLLSTKGLLKPRLRSRKELRGEYEAKIHRPFKADFALYARAKKFSELIGKWHTARDKQEVANFFAHLGSESFEYLEVIPALIQLTGREHVLVNSLTMYGGDISIESVDEGSIIHPRDEVEDLLQRV